MPRSLFKILGNTSVYLEPDDGTGGKGGGSDDAAAEAAAAKALAEAAAAKVLADAEAAKALEDDKSSKPSDAEAKLLKELMSLKAKQKAADEELKVLKSALGETSADDIKLMLEQKKADAIAAQEKRGEYDRILEQVKAEHARETSTLSEQIAALNLQVIEKDDSLMNLTVGRAFSESPFIRDKSRIPASIARKEFGSFVDIVDGQAVVYDKPRGASERTPIVDGSGKPKSFEDGIQALYANHPDSSALIRAQVKPGAGSQNIDLGGKKPDDGSKEVAPGASRITQALNARDKK